MLRNRPKFESNTLFINSSKRAKTSHCAYFTRQRPQELSELTTLDGFLAVGSGTPNHVKAEMYEFGTGSWRAVDDYPFGNGKKITNNFMIYIDEMASYFIIAGYDGKTMSKIARFTEGVWYDAGKLETERVVSFRLFFCCF